MPQTSRRVFLSAVAAGLCLNSLPGDAFSEPEAAVPPSPQPVATVIPLWPAEPPGGGGPDEALPMVSPAGSISRIARPQLQVFRPARPNGAAVLVAGGGGYQHISMRHESLPAARWLQKLGVTVFVLSYRLPEEGWHAGALAPVQDAQRAIRLIHAQADQYGLDRKRIGALGFSAGGHLMGLCAARPDWQTYPAIDSADSLRPDINLVLLAYPVVTLEAPYLGTRSRRTLLGPHPTPAEATAWSVQTYIHKGCPPFFLVQAADDRITVPENTAVLQAACQRNTVPVTRYIFPSGGHGFGLGYRETATATWPHLAENWMKQQHFIA
ncbi:alpha/beta hydrolase [Acetobacter indonesiensis]|uniref:Pectin acetylesterase n=2 Tax=Acetobacter indonesiensis TaxID=104101 RepID=A0A252AY76_9PROT|nr:alpha/beta hydrolase [Acetobacter indonesiensis]MCI1436871.1 alpha/beta hydrolase [Acetobacter indonesiensis]MCI1546006.1 alpha/beta hydrolase [Acetobacter indonesiensis]MCI1765452.1 alpha/beta hydrolase [Acetobacter indonesiensis]OUI96399.1 pectin acetylesterase [Acetobacter indonesiensis]GAN63374.1 hypothetical protein Abin_026_020 [Acetobacter indonesiensis]